MAVLSSIGGFVGIALANYFLRKGFDKLFTNKEDFTRVLSKVIDDTTAEFKSKYPQEEIAGKYHFYDSQKIINELLSFRVMKKEGYNEENLYNAIKDEEKVILPSQEDFDRFYSIFIKKVTENAKLKEKEIQETFGEEIFSVSGKVDNVAEKVDTILHLFTEHFKPVNPISQLNKETSDYNAKEYKYNQLFTKTIVDAMFKDESCQKKYCNFYEVISNIGQNWDAEPDLCFEGKEMILEKFDGIFVEQLNTLYSIGNEPQSLDKKIKYIKQCHYIVKRTIDLIIFVFLSKLWDDKEKIKLSGGTPLREYFPIAKKQITLLRNLIRIYKKQKNDDNLLIPEILAFSEQFNETGELYNANIELEKLYESFREKDSDVPVSKPTNLDCFIAEKQLTVFFENFCFLANYKVVSMKKIECFHTKYVKEKKYLQNHECLGSDKHTNICIKMGEPLFTYDVLLYKGDDYSKNINLFPFIIDINALDNAMDLEFNISNIAFISHVGLVKQHLIYDYLNPDNDSDKSFTLEYMEIMKQKDKEKMCFLTNDEMKKYNKDFVFDTFKRINENLYI